VTGPSGFSATANLHQRQPTGNGAARVATYRLTPAGHTVAGWDASDFSPTTPSRSSPARSSTTTAQSVPPRLSVSSSPDPVDVDCDRDGRWDGRRLVPRRTHRRERPRRLNDIITFRHSVQYADTVDLTTTIGSLVINDPVTIQGPGASRFILNGANVVRPFTITDAASSLRQSRSRDWPARV